jgi:hypothetical protein
MLDTSYNDVNTRVSILDTSYNDVNTRVSILDTSYNDVNTRVTVLDTSYNDVNTRVTMLDTSYNDVNTRVSILDTSYNDVNTRVSILDTSYNDVNTRVSILDTSYNDVNTRVSILDTSYNDVNTRVSILDTSYNDVNTRVSMLDTSYNDVNTRVTMLDTSYNDVNTRVTMLDTSYNDVNTRVSILDTSYNDVNTRVSMLDTSYNDVNTRVSMLDTSYNDVNTRVTMLDTSYNDVNTRVTMLDTSFSIISSNIVLTSVSGDIIPYTNYSYKLGDVSRNWSNAYIRDISATNISISGNIVPLFDLTSNLGSSLKRWNNVYVDDLSVNKINGLPYGGSGGSSNIVLTSVSGNIVPLLDLSSSLGSSLKRWSNAHIRDISASNISTTNISTTNISATNISTTNISTTNISISRNIEPIITLTLTDPSWIQLGTDIDGELDFDQSGFSVSLNADGTIVAIGAYLNDGINGSDSGHVRVYQYNNNASASDPSWIQLGSDIDGDLSPDKSGYSVSLNADGTIVAIGAIWNDGIVADSNIGHVKVYQYNNSASDPSWIQLGTDIDGELENDQSGYSVSLNAAGTIVAICDLIGDGTITTSIMGLVRVYEYNTTDTSWIQLGTNIDAALSDRGRSVSLNATGTILAIGAHYWDNNGTEDSLSGRVKVYEYRTSPDIGWIQLGTDIDDEIPGDQSGFSVSLNDSGTRLAIGAKNNAGTVADSYRGHVRVYEYRTSPDISWIQLGTDIDGESTFDRSGFSVSLNATGTIVAIGAPYSDINGSNSGHVRVYQYNESASDPSWIQIGTDIDGESSHNYSGFSISLNADGTRVAIGAFGNDGNGTDSGHVRIYEVNQGYNYSNITSLGTATNTWNNAYIRDISATNISISGNIVPTQTNDWFSMGTPIAGLVIPNNQTGYSVSLNADGTIFAVGATNLESNNYIITGDVRVYRYNDTDWVPMGEPIVIVPMPSQTGYSISLNATGTILAIGSINQDNTGYFSGSIGVYRYGQWGWVPMGDPISPGSIPSDRSEFSMSLNADGTVLAIGSINENIRIYKYTQTGWGLIGEPIIHGIIPDYSIGYSVSLNAAGTIVAIGANNFDYSNNSNAGSVRVYRYGGILWEPIGDPIVGDLIPYAESAGITAGYSVSLNATGTIIAIGAINQIFETITGNIRIYKYTYGSWVPMGEPIIQDNNTIPNDGSDYSISLNADGTILAIGGSYMDFQTGIFGGNIRIYRYNDTSWIPMGEPIIHGIIPNDGSGYSISLNADGTVVVIGASNQDNWTGTTSGKVSVYRYNENRSLGSATNTWSNAYINSLNANYIIVDNLLPVNDNYSNLGIDTNTWSSAYIDSLNANSINVADNLVPVTDNHSNLGLDTNRWATSYINALNATSINVADNLVPVADNYSSLGVDGIRWATLYINNLIANSISIVDNIVPVNDNHSNLGLETNRWNNAYINDLNVTETVTFGGSTLYVPSLFTIDPIGHGDNTGTVQINGNLVVQGVTTTINSSILDISDKMIVFASNASNSLQADGAGFEISGAKVNLLYNNSSNTFRSSIGLTISGNVVPGTNNVGSLGESGKYWRNAYIRDVSATNIEVSGNIVPLRDLSSNLGSSLKRWRNVFVDDLSVNKINGVAYTGSSGSVVRNLKMFVSPPTSAEATLNVAVGNAAGRGFHGLFTDGRYAYLVPYQNPTVGQSGVLTRVDLNNWTDSGVSYLNVASGNALACGFSGGFTDGRYGYLVPYTNNTSTHGICTRIDLQNFTSGGVSYLDVAVGNANAKQFASGFTDGTYAYLIPMANGIFTRINLQNFTAGGVSYLNLTTINSAYWGGFVYGNFGYLVPSSSGIFVRVNLVDWTIGSVSSLNVSVGNVLANGFRGGFTDGTYGYLAPYGPYGTGPHGIFTRVNLQDFTNSGVSYLNVAVNNSSAKGFWGAFTDGQYGYLVPYNNGGAGHGILTRVNLQTFSTSGVSYLNLALMNSTSTGLAEGFTDGKYAYFSPYGSGFYNSTFTRVNISNIYNTYI